MDAKFSNVMAFSSRKMMHGLERHLAQPAPPILRSDGSDSAAKVAENTETK